MKKMLLTGTGVILVLGLTALPSSANYQSWLSSFLGDWQNQAQQMQSRLNNLLAVELAGISIDFGDLGLPDISDISQEIEDIYREQGDHVLADEASHQVVREVTEEKAEGTLSQSGQATVQNKLETIDQTVKTLETQASQAQSETVTQNVLKQIALQNAQQGLLIGGLQTEITDLSVKQDLANRNLANISEGVDSENLREQAELEGGANSVLHTTTLLRMSF
jgi:hypothetical protein